MASIYSKMGETITAGLQGCKVCDEARKMAKREAIEMGETVYLEDDDGNWAVEPDGTRSNEGTEWMILDKNTRD